jgi:peptidoglycan/LPS O-acetylase OafA/YrhL
MQTHHRVGEYFIGIIAGYLMHHLTIPEISKHSKRKEILNLFGWFFSLSFLTIHTFFDPKSHLNQTNQNIYDTISKELWSISICWIIFACHYMKSGGVIQSILSYQCWQPIAKMSLSIYLLHYIYIYLTLANLANVQTWWQIHIHVGDVFISITLAAISFIFIEAPAGNLSVILWKWREGSLKNEKHSQQMQLNNQV